MWSDVQPGKCVIIELNTRWYLGVVESRTEMTCRLNEALCGHLIGDLGLFLGGDPVNSELTPLPRPIEINLAVGVLTASEYPYEHLLKVRKRTHKPNK